MLCLGSDTFKTALLESTDASAPSRALQAPIVLYSIMRCCSQVTDCSLKLLPIGWCDRQSGQVFLEGTTCTSSTYPQVGRVTICISLLSE